MKTHPSYVPRLVRGIQKPMEQSRNMLIYLLQNGPNRHAVGRRRRDNARSLIAFSTHFTITIAYQPPPNAFDNAITLSSFFSVTSNRFKFFA